MSRAGERAGDPMAKPSQADFRRTLLSSGYMIAFVAVAFVLGASWLAAMLLDELGP